MINDNEHYEKVITKIYPFIEECFHLQKQIFKGMAPQGMLEGMVLGYLLGKGLNYEESSIGVYQYSKIIQKLVAQDPLLSKTFVAGALISMDSNSGIKIDAGVTNN